MNACNATLITATVTECPDDEAGMECGHAASKRYHEGRTQHVELHTLTCDLPHPHYSRIAMKHEAGRRSWGDDWPGAKPHTPTSTVTNDDEWVRALRAVNAPEDIIERAARRVRAAQEDDR